MFPYTIFRIRKSTSWEQPKTNSRLKGVVQIYYLGVILSATTKTKGDSTEMFIFAGNN